MRARLPTRAPADDVAVAAQGLGQAVHDDVGAQPQGPLQERRGEGVVHHDGQARRVGLARDLFDVDHLDRGVRRALEHDQAAARPRHLAQPQQVRGATIRLDMPHFGRRLAHELRRASVERRAGQDLVACLEHGEDAGGGGGHARREDDARLRAFEAASASSSARRVGLP
jgi:hypothetical protein